MKELEHDHRVGAQILLVPAPPPVTVSEDDLLEKRAEARKALLFDSPDEIEGSSASGTDRVDPTLTLFFAGEETARFSLPLLGDSSATVVTWRLPLHSEGAPYDRRVVAANFLPELHGAACEPQGGFDEARMAGQLNQVIQETMSQDGARKLTEMKVSEFLVGDRQAQKPRDGALQREAVKEGMQLCECLGEIRRAIEDILKASDNVHSAKSRDKLLTDTRVAAKCSEKLGVGRAPAVSARRMGDMVAALPKHEEGEDEGDLERRGAGALAALGRQGTWLWACRSEELEGRAEMLEEIGYEERRVNPDTWKPFADAVLRHRDVLMNDGASTHCGVFFQLLYNAHQTTCEAQTATGGMVHGRCEGVEGEQLTCQMKPKTLISAGGTHYSVVMMHADGQELIQGIKLPDALKDVSTFGVAKVIESMRQFYTPLEKPFSSSTPGKPNWSDENHFDLAAELSDSKLMGIRIEAASTQNCRSAKLQLRDAFVVRLAAPPEGKSDVQVNCVVQSEFRADRRSGEVIRVGLMDVYAGGSEERNNTMTGAEVREMMGGAENQCVISPRYQWERPQGAAEDARTYYRRVAPVAIAHDRWEAGVIVDIACNWLGALKAQRPALVCTSAATDSKGVLVTAKLHLSSSPNKVRFRALVENHPSNPSD